MFQSGQTELFESGTVSELNRIKLDLIREGRTPVDLSMINPDIPPPRFLMDKLSEATIKASNHRYSVSRGVRKLRSGFAQKYESKFGVRLDPEESVCVTMGTKDALVNSLFCLTQPGQSVLLAAPTYPAHRSACQISGLTLRYFEIEDGVQATLKNIEVSLEQVRPKVLLLNFPNNPTGMMVGADFFRAVYEAARRYDCMVINDFVYGEMGYRGDAAVSALSACTQRVGLLEIYSLSKAYSIPGWRIGALVGDSQAVQKLARLKSHIDYGIFLPLQIAAAAALTANQDLVEPTLDEYRRRSRTLIQGLRSLGWEVSTPQAGASVWAKIPAVLSSHYQSSSDLAKELLLSQGVLATPGELFGESYQNYLRFALVVSSEQLYDVVQRLNTFVPNEGETRCAAAS